MPPHFRPNIAKNLIFRCLIELRMQYNGGHSVSDDLIPPAGAQLVQFVSLDLLSPPATDG